MDKNELLDELLDEREEMEELLAGLPDERLLEPGVIGSWSIKDALAHLTFWEGQMVTLLFQVQRGVETPNSAQFSQEPVDTLNQRWYEAGKDRALEQVLADWQGVRKQTIRRVGELSEDELNDPALYPWLKGQPLYQWVLSDTIEHEAEHADQIREWLEKRDTAEK